jgi:outer membrane protein
MLKKIVLFFICVLPLSLIAQETKLGHVNFQEIVTLMPELSTIQKTLDDQSKVIETELSKMNEELTAKFKDFQDKQATMPETIKQTRQNELQDIQQRIQTFRQTASTDLQKKQQELLAPVYQKINKVISEIAAEGKYLYIFQADPQILIYQAPNANDLTPAVKKRLGLDKKPATETQK